MQTVVAKHRNVNRDIPNPILRFKGFTDDWKEINFRDVFSFKATNSLSREALTDEIGQIKNIHYGDIHTKYRSRFYITKEEVPYIKSDIDLSRIAEESYCKVGDIVIADASEDYQDIGKSIEIIETNNQKILAGLHTFIARPIDNTFALGFLGYLMRSNTMRLQIMILAQGSKVLGISTKHLDEVIVKIPTLQEQQKIASFLSSIDDWIENLSQQKLVLEKYKKGMMQKIFTQEIRFKDENGKDFPDWEEKLLGKILKVERGGSPRPIEKYITNNNDGIPWIKIGDLKPGSRYVTETAEKIKPEGAKNSREVHPGDFILSNSMSYGRPYIVNIYGCIHDGWLALRNVEKNIVRDDFLYEVLQSDSIKKKFLALAAGSAVKNLKSETVKGTKVNIPSLIEQEKIASFLSSIDNLIELKEMQISQYELWKKGLMQKLFI